MKDMKPATGPDPVHMPQEQWSDFAEGPAHRASGWLPIETAPRDGTPILMYLLAPSKQAVFIGEAFAQIVVGDLWVESNFLKGPLGNTAEATHWMPLPPPPEALEESDG